MKVFSFVEQSKVSTRTVPCSIAFRASIIVRQTSTMQVETCPPGGYTYSTVCRLVVCQVVVKTIMTKESAEEALAHGVVAAWVSNHGGRQLDTVPATIEILPEVRVD